MSNPAPITLAALFRYWRGLPHQAAAIGELEADLQANGYAVAMRRDRLWFHTWSTDGKQADTAWLAPALQIVKEFEGCRLQAYRCPAGVWTIGWGATAIGGRPVVDGQAITQQQADLQLTADLQRFHAGVLDALPMVASWAPHRQAALVSWAFNVGVGAVRTSTLRQRLLAANDPPAQVISEELPRWNRANGKVLPGLTRRRAAEVRLFLGHQSASVTPTGAQQAPQEWATRIQALNLSQPDSKTCQAACIAMAVGDRDIAGIRQRLVARGSAGDPSAMRQVIQNYKVQYEYAGNACLNDAYDWLKAGEFLITHGWFTGSGHVICLDGLRREASGRHRLNVKDPWSEFNASTWAYDLGSEFFDGFYSDLLIYATCVAGVSCEDARAVYRRNAMDTSRRGMWVHRFLPTIAKKQ